MSGERLSTATQALLKAAKADAPSAAARTKVWAGVSGAVGGTAGAAGSAGLGGSAAGAGAGASLSAAKMLAIGTLLGGTVTVGLASMLLYVSPVHVGNAARGGVPAITATPASMSDGRPSPLLPRRHMSTAPASGVRAAPVTPTPGIAVNVVPSIPASASLAPHPGAAAGASGTGRRATGAVTGADRGSQGPEDPLSREASLVAEARSLLAHGDAPGALRLVRAARAMPSPQLVPEELTVEAQALRSLGQSDSARGVDETLRSRYPDSALAR